MSVDRALEVLGLTGAPSQDELRRAYLRQVRQHSPERDRDGFQRVREAFDFLKANPWALERPSTPVETDDEQEEVDGQQAPAFVQAPPPGPAVLVTEEPPAEVPPAPTDQDLERLNRALAEDDPEAAAAAMNALYARPLIEAAPVPPPLFCLRTVTALVERNRFDSARALLEAFEGHTTRSGLESGLGGEFGARWKLVRETVALIELDEPLAQSVAISLANDWLPKAADAVDDAYERGVEVEDFMRQHAPALWSSLAPYLKPKRREVRRGAGARTPAWLISMALAVLFALFRACSADVATPSYSLPHAHAVQAAEQTPAEPAPAAADAPAPPLSFRERAARDLDAKWQAIADVVARGDCEGVREQWPAYRKVAEPDLVAPPIAAARKKQILDMCAELAELLEETP